MTIFTKKLHFRTSTESDKNNGFYMRFWSIQIKVYICKINEKK